MAMGLGLGLVPPPQVVLQNMGDEDASMQEDEPMYAGHPIPPYQYEPHHQHGFHPPALSIPHQSQSHSYLGVNNLDGIYSASPRSASPNRHYMNPSASLYPHPAISFTPATPLELTPTSEAHPQTPPLMESDAMMMSSARTASFNGCIDSPVSPRAGMRTRQKFSMGPRSDCEKCRMGVKGHSVHFS